MPRKEQSDQVLTGPEVFNYFDSMAPLANNVLQHPSGAQEPSYVTPCLPSWQPLTLFQTPSLVECSLNFFSSLLGSRLGSCCCHPWPLSSPGPKERSSSEALFCALLPKEGGNDRLGLL
uniref:Uncharacterized protein n=1 Tax=Podarcis muralis TaxID=64176 RepID=A0A670HXC1_PODMU